MSTWTLSSEPLAGYCPWYPTAHKKFSTWILSWQDITSEMKCCTADVRGARLALHLRPGRKQSVPAAKLDSVWIPVLQAVHGGTVSEQRGLCSTSGYNIRPLRRPVANHHFYVETQLTTEHSHAWLKVGFNTNWRQLCSLGCCCFVQGTKPWNSTLCCQNRTKLRIKMLGNYACYFSCTGDEKCDRRGPHVLRRNT